MIETVNKPTIRFIDEKHRKNGISAFLRIRNGESFLSVSIDSIINDVDEVICVVNRSKDSTLDILDKYQKKYPDQIKVYHYLPIVYPAGSKEHKEYSENSYHNLAYYTNYSLSKTTHKYMFKLDDDEIFYPGSIKNLYSICIRNNISMFGLRGINLLDLDQKLYVNKKYEKTGGKDTLFFKYNSSCKFVKNEKYEIFQSNMEIKEIIDCFYHLKFCKKDRGQNNYDLTENPQSRYINIGMSFLKSISKENLIPIENKQYSLNPFDLGLRLIDNSVKTYNFQPFQEIEDNIIRNKNFE